MANWYWRRYKDQVCKPHGILLCPNCHETSDAGKRAFDIVNGFVHFVSQEERVRSWVAIRLSDGGSDGVLYPSKLDAARHQLTPKQCAYFSYRGSPSGFASRKEADLWLGKVRMEYDDGFGPALTDLDDAHGGLETIQPLDAWQYRQQMSRLIDPRARN